MRGDTRHRENVSFNGAHAHSILKKRRLRDERNNKPYELTLSEWYEEEAG